jgi:hypothetical protein
MSSAGSAVSLFGDRRYLLILDLSASHKSMHSDVIPLPDITSTTPYSSFLKFIRAYHSPPDTYVYYTASYETTIESMIKRVPVGVSHVLILEGESNEEGGGAQSSGGIAGHIHSLYPSVPSDRHKSIRPSISVVTTRSEATTLPGVDHVYLIGSGAMSEAQVAQQFGDFLMSGITLAGATARVGIRELEELRPQRSALIEPTWMANIVDTCFNHISSEISIFPTIESTRLDQLKHYIDDWNFYAPSLSRPELLNVILLIFERFELLDSLEVERAIFQEFILVIEHNYHENPYHNFYHAVDVLQCCYHVLNTSMMMRRMLKPVDTMALFIAALSHDVGHPSFNNPFLVENESLVAWLYNDTAALENMHSTILFAILRHPRYNFASKWPRGQWKDFRSLVVSSILGTDMSQHFEYIRQFSGIDGSFSRALKCLNSGEGPLPIKDRRLLSIAIIKFADICNAIRPFDFARKWGFHLVGEFVHQGDWEKALGYQSTPMTFRSLPDLAKGQQYFLNNVASPLYRAVVEHFSELHFAEDQLRINLELWRTWKPETDDAIHTYSELYPPDRERHHSH